MSTEKHKEGGFHYHIGVWNGNASRNTVVAVVRRMFPEFEGRQCNVSSHKGWNTICRYLLKQDECPVVWGEESVSRGDS